MQVVGYWSFPLGLVDVEKKKRRGKNQRGGGILGSDTIILATSCIKCSFDNGGGGKS